jgi:hypothetical protein
LLNLFYLNNQLSLIDKISFTYFFQFISLHKVQYALKGITFNYHFHESLMTYTLCSFQNLFFLKVKQSLKMKKSQICNEHNELDNHNHMKKRQDLITNSEYIFIVYHL